MNYELAKKLKEAGFPKETFIVHYPNAKYPNRCGQSGTPTLSELIEACGGELQVLKRPYAGKGWFAHNSKATQGIGLTPEEAVANLWLELNKK